MIASLRHERNKVFQAIQNKVAYEQYPARYILFVDPIHDAMGATRNGRRPDYMFLFLGQLGVF